jgi:hypothetical protein
MSSSSTGTTSRPSAQSRRCRTRCMNLPGSKSMALRVVSKITVQTQHKPTIYECDRSNNIISQSGRRVTLLWRFEHGDDQTLGRFRSHKPQMGIDHKVGKTHKLTTGFIKFHIEVLPLLLPTIQLLQCPILT